MLTPLWFLGKAIEKLSTADIAVFVEGYEEARGCIIERECTSLYNIPSYVAFNNGTISKNRLAYELSYRRCAFI